MNNLINDLEGLKEGEFAKVFHKSAIYDSSNIEEILKYAKNNILKKLIILAIITIAVVLLFTAGFALVILPWIIVVGAIYVIFKVLKKFKIF